MSEDSKGGGDRLLKKLSIHTMLTTGKAIREYRGYRPPPIIVYVKALPEGVIKRLYVEPGDSVFHLYNMFLSHCKLGMATDPMLVIPLDDGFYELDNTVTIPNEYQIADLSAFLPLSRYKFSSEMSRNHQWQSKGNILILCYFQRYLPLKAINSVRFYMERNSSWTPTHEFNVYASPDGMPSVATVRDDPVQAQLRDIVIRQFKDQTMAVEQGRRIDA